MRPAGLQYRRSGNVLSDSAQQPDVAVAVIVIDGRVLLVHRRADDGAPPWVLPGGKIKPGERAGEAAVREAREETGLEVAAHRVLGERLHPVTGHRITYVACDVGAGTAQVAAPEEADAVAWVPIGELRAYVPDGLYAPVMEYLDGR
jgi:8-oxo-dGTP diphosphatase